MNEPRFPRGTPAPCPDNPDDCCDHLAEVQQLREQVRKALAANERDRATLHKIVRQIDDEITGRMWLLEGRGCYEWDDDRYRQEFGWAVNALQAKLEPLRKIAGDLTDSPTTSEAVRAALAEQDPRLRFL